jgi:chromosome partitioning protein
VRKIAVVNKKGGVGKTTTAVNLGAALARLGYVVQVLDLDPQAHATLHLGIDPGGKTPSIYDVLTSNATLSEARVPVAENLWVVGSHLDLAAIEVELAGVPGREARLRDLLDAELQGNSAPLAPRHGLARRTTRPSAWPTEQFDPRQTDFILMDCPPSLGLLSLNALTAAEEVLIPLQPHFLALHGMSKLLETIALVQRRVNRRLRVTGIVLCMVEPSTKLGAEVEADLARFLDDCRSSDLPWAHAVIFETKIRRNIRLAECPSHGKSIFDYAPHSNGARDYFDLALEILRVPPGGNAGRPADVRSVASVPTVADLPAPSSGKCPEEPALPTWED